MFTGIIQGQGQVTTFKGSQKGAEIAVSYSFPLRDVQLGESVAVDGCCLTVTRIGKKQLSFDLSDETLRLTTLGTFKKGRQVNLERAMRPLDRFGGHFVLGHVDGVGQIRKMIRHEGSLEILVEYPKKLAPYLIEKGSITIDGISLTICNLKKNAFSVFIVPHTEKETTLPLKKPGDQVNLEADILGKYVERLLSLRKR